MAQLRAGRSRPISLLDCLNDSLECGICIEQNELRLLPCQHMICLGCLEGIQQTSLNSKKIYSCPFCREDLTEPPEAYPICRLAREFKQQVQQLSSALKRRRSYQQTSCRAASTRNKSNHKHSHGAHEETITKQLNETDNQDESAKVNLRASRPKSFSNDEDRCQRCFGQNVTWICVRCHNFLCSHERCRQGKCAVVEENSVTHQVKYVEDEVETSMEHFEDVKKKLRIQIDETSIEGKFLHLEVKTLAREVANGTEDEMVTLRSLQKFREKDAAWRRHTEELQEAKDMLSTLEEFVREASDVEYVMVAQWIFENEVSDEPRGQAFNSSRYEVSLGACELITTSSYHHISPYESLNQLIITNNETFDMVNVSNGKISKSGRKFDACQCLSVKEYKEKLYCLCKVGKSKVPEIWVVDPQNPKNIASWKTLMSDTEGFVMQADRAYVYSKKYIRIHTLEGVELRLLSHVTAKEISDMTAFGDNLLAICDLGRDKVMVVKSFASDAWTVTVRSPAAICSDWLSTLWVWSRNERMLTRISRESPVQVLSHPLFTETIPLDSMATIHVRNGFLWMASRRYGLRRFAIKLTRNRTPEQNADRRGVTQALQQKLARGKYKTLTYALEFLCHKLSTTKKILLIYINLISQCNTLKCLWTYSPD